MKAKAVVVGKTDKSWEHAEITVTPFCFHFEVGDKWVVMDHGDLSKIQAIMKLKWKEHQVENAIKFKLEAIKDVSDF